MRFREILEAVEIPKANKGGNCYQVAYRYSQNHPDLKLVHGLVQGQGALKGVRYNHAWVEDTKNVFDLTLPKKYQKMPKEDYYALGKIKDVFRYSQKEILDKILKYETYGPWETVLLKK